jgi:hypothetical protein
LEISDFLAEGSEIFVLFGRIRPGLIDSDGGLNIGTGLVEVPKLAVIAAELEFNVGIVGKFAFGFQKDRTAVLKGVMVSDGISK